MDSATQERLIAAARAVLAPRRLSPTAEAGSVGAALLAASGRIFTGVCLDLDCGIGFCAEHAAAAAMVTAGEARIAAMVAVDRDGTILPPCGRCRELVAQLEAGNAGTEVILPGKVVTIRALLPDHWLIDRPPRPEAPGV